MTLNDHHPADSTDFAALWEEAKASGYGIAFKNGTYTIIEGGEEAEEATSFTTGATVRELQEQIEALAAAVKDCDEMNVDEDYRITLLELGIEGE